MSDDDGCNPVEPFSQDEFVTHSSRELQKLDADGNEDEDKPRCPRCGAEVRYCAVSTTSLHTAEVVARSLEAND